MDEEKLRKIGVCHGMVHALAALKLEIGSRMYHPIPPHHTRRMRERNMEVAPLRKMYSQIERDLRALQAHLGE